MYVWILRMGKVGSEKLIFLPSTFYLHSQGIWAFMPWTNEQVAQSHLLFAKCMKISHKEGVQMLMYSTLLKLFSLVIF